MCPVKRARALAAKIAGKHFHPSLFEPSEPAVDSLATVRLKEVRVERARRFGDVYLGLALWHSLQLDEAFDQLIPRGREDVPCSNLAAALVIFRLCMPSSELHLAEEGYRQCALGDLLGIPEEKINDDRLYRGLDRILPHKDAIERHLKNRLGVLLEYDDAIVDDAAQGAWERVERAVRRQLRRPTLDLLKSLLQPLLYHREGMAG